MEPECRAVVVPFPSPRGRDQEINAEWDLLISQTTQAWSWRDPESLDALENTLARLRARIRRDWAS